MREAAVEVNRVFVETPSIGGPTKSSPLQESSARVASVAPRSRPGKGSSGQYCADSKELLL